MSDSKQSARVKKILASLREGVDYCFGVAKTEAHFGENLSSLLKECKLAIEEIQGLELKLA